MKSKKFTKEARALFAEGRALRSYETLGAHPVCENGEQGYRFALWAPHAKRVQVTGTFCGCDWSLGAYPMHCEQGSGIWYLFISGAKSGDYYKYVIETDEGELLYKADPYAFFSEVPPGTASRLAPHADYPWRDGAWLQKRKKSAWRAAPLNIYEVHLGSWKRHEDGSHYSYRELAETLVPYVSEMGYTHIEMMPVMEHPYDGSWGYQITGYYAPSSRYGAPEDFKYLIDCCHKKGLGVILDWVPGHFCRDEHGLGCFDGEKLYEKDEHAQWGTYRFDFERGEVRSFLISNALYWMEEFHADALRVDGVTSMLYLNFGVDDPSQKIFNEKGTEENLAAIDFIHQMNKSLGCEYPEVLLMAEESTAWPLVTYPPEDGGLGYHLKWDMGWMNDTLNYMRTDFPYKESNHSLLTFSIMYAFNENFILPLSHDEVVHGKASLIGRMPGDYWRQFAGLRILAMYQMCHPGGKLNFMGNEIGQFIEWRYQEGIEWFLLEFEAHEKHRQFVKALNLLYQTEKAMWQRSYTWDGFQWLDADNGKQAVISFIRRGEKPADDLIVVLNFRPDAYGEFSVGVPRKGTYVELFNSDHPDFGGSGGINPKPIESAAEPMHGMEHSVTICLPPVGGVILKRVPQPRKQTGKPKKIEKSKRTARKAK